MIIYNFIGGLGNQLFQYLFLIQLDKDGNNDIKIRTYDYNYLDPHNGFVVNQILDIKHDIYQGGYNFHFRRILRKMPFFIRKILNYNFEYDVLYKNTSNSFIEGYFQTSIFYRNNIYELFMNLPFNEYFKTQYDEFSKLIDKDDLAIHIRGGDLFQSGRENIYFIPGQKYFDDAIQYFKNENPNIRLHLFTNDITIYNEFKIKYDNMYLDDNDPIKAWIKLSVFKNIICSNSTFSFLASFYNYKEKKVFLPKRVFNQKSEMPFVYDFINNLYNSND
jgi:hypothetical protein